MFVRASARDRTESNLDAAVVYKVRGDAGNGMCGGRTSLALLQLSVVRVNKMIKRIQEYRIDLQKNADERFGTCDYC